MIGEKRISVDLNSEPERQHRGGGKVTVYRFYGEEKILDLGFGGDWKAFREHS